MHTRAAGDALEAAASWDKPLGRAVLHTASLILLRPAAKAISGLKALDLAPDEEEIVLIGGPFASLKANTTRLHVGGLQSLQTFPELRSDGPEHVLATSAFHILEARAHLDTSFHGPFGAGAGVQPLVLSASLSNVSLCLRFRCSLKRGALSASVVKGSLAGLDRSSLTLELADVRVLVGDIVVSIADGGSRNENGEEAAPSLVWKLFSRALSTTLRAMVEEQAAIAIREAVEEILRGDLPTGGRSKRRGGGGAPPPSTLPASPPLSTDAGLGEEAATGYEQEGKPDEQQQEQGNKQASAMAEEEEEAPVAVEASSADGQGAALSDSAPSCEGTAQEST